MTHLLDNHCRIIDVDGEPTRFGHVGIDPDPARDEYYNKLYESRRRFYGADSVAKMPLRASLMLLPDLLIAHRITLNPRYDEFYRRVVARFKDNPEPEFPRPQSAGDARARANHSSEGQAYEALYNLNRLERDPELLARYRQWTADLWQRNWMEGNALFTYMTLALLPEYRPPDAPGKPRADWRDVPHAAEAMRLSAETLARFPPLRILPHTQTRRSGSA